MKVVPSECRCVVLRAPEKDCVARFFGKRGEEQPTLKAKPLPKDKGLRNSSCCDEMELMSGLGPRRRSIAFYAFLSKSSVCVPRLLFPKKILRLFLGALFLSVGGPRLLMNFHRKKRPLPLFSMELMSGLGPPTSSLPNRFFPSNRFSDFRNSPVNGKICIFHIIKTVLCNIRELPISQQSQYLFLPNFLHFTSRMRFFRHRFISIL